ncbi:hypothetical protein IDSA_11440 [Pseudidiomarina salinarum]|uniref:AbrB family transcriptional regulator n=1 Tax=Pseudidiomarina salinarum TaxID=435908 RepID=A0A094L618_9GAMM|nr:hypothetical protein [Pseudidiomarina salinarum]KFZ30168.1 hypothetical protein IDSA_11440 [Pseudidiomarina salinarum]RUO68669.1 hypothetical protein CWI79_11420 [Pseudidiomarina salinarum]
MNYQTYIQEHGDDGLIELPEDELRRLGWEPGTNLLLELVDGQIFVSEAPAQTFGERFISKAKRILSPLNRSLRK